MGARGSHKKRLTTIMAMACALSWAQASPASDWVEDPYVKARQGGGNLQINPAFSSVVSKKSLYSNEQDSAGQVGGSDSEHEADSDRNYAARSNRRQTAAVAPLQGNVTSNELASPRETEGTTQGIGINAGNILQSAPIPPYPDSKNVGPSEFKSWLRKTQGVTITPNNKDAILVIKGEWDNSSHILEACGLRYAKISPGALAKTPWQKASVMIVDCPGSFPNAEALEAVHDFVYAGGYLVTTDWALDNCLTRAIPGYVEANGAYSYPQLVDAVVVDPLPELVKGTVPVARWKLDDKCQLAAVSNKSAVHVLVRSRKLMREEQSIAGLGILALTFDYGRGKVLHVVGHFDTNTSGAFTNSLADPSPQMGISLRQGIIINFIMAGLKAHLPDAGSR